MTFSRFLPIALLSTCCLLQGCSSVKKTLGIEKDAPDEFAVDPTIQPLDMPPDFFTLPQPQPGIPRPQDIKALQDKQAKIIGNPSSSTPSTSGQKALLEMAGANEIQSDIRQKVDQESKIASTKGKPILESLGLKAKKPDGKVINPYEESAALKEQGIPTN